jgi:hypothetical protein
MVSIATWIPVFLCDYFSGFRLFKELFHSRRLLATEYQIQDFDVFSIGLETRCTVGSIGNSGPGCGRL